MDETVTPTGPRQFRGPVFVLSNRRSYSTAENFILAMRSLPNVTVIGDTTAAASGARIVRELANGWTYQLPEWIEYTTDHRAYEGIGLAPDGVVKGTLQDSQRAVDAALERALALAHGSTYWAVLARISRQLHGTNSGEGEDPRLHAAELGVVPARLLPRLKEDVRHHVLDVAGSSCHAPYQTVHVRMPPIIERAESGFLSICHVSDQHAVIHLGVQFQRSIAMYPR